MILRPYQTSGVAELRSRFEAGIKRLCYVAPCGAGKTVVMDYMASEAAQRKYRVLFMVHRQELIDQAHATLTARHGIIAPGYPATDDLVQIGSIQTLARRLDHIMPPDFIIPDECHHAMAATWRKVLDKYPNAWVVGLTATPARLGGQGLGEVFEELVLGPEAKWLIENDFLAPYKYYAPPMVADMTGVKTERGDYDQSETAVRVDKPAVIGDAISHYVKYASGKLAIVYCASVAHSKNTVDAFNAQGIRAKHIDGTTPKESRKQIIEEFRQGRITVLCNVDLISEGFDCPGAEVSILLRPTQSLTLFIQQAMRCMRPGEGKTAIILDHVGNVFRHGMPCDHREWSLTGTVKRRKSEAALITVRQCPMCYRALPGGVQACECGYQFPVESRVLAVKEGDLQELTAVEKFHKKLEVWQAKTYQDFLQIARERGYKDSWAYCQMKLREGRNKKKVKE